MIKNQLWTGLLVALLILGSLASATLSVVYVRSTRKLQDLQLKANVITQYKNVMQMLANEAMEYSRRDPSMEPILNSIGIRTRPAPETKK